jgi:hypothetical protein
MRRLWSIFSRPRKKDLKSETSPWDHRHSRIVARAATAGGWARWWGRWTNLTILYIKTNVVSVCLCVRHRPSWIAAKVAAAGGRARCHGLLWRSRWLEWRSHGLPTCSIESTHCGKNLNQFSWVIRIVIYVMESFFVF